MFQEKVNGNVDCLYKWQVDETQHQDGRVSWSLVVNTLLFTILYTKYNEDYSALILLNILMGIVTSVSIFYSVRVGELATGTVYEKWDAYDHQSIKEKCKPIPHVISLAPSTILRSKWNFISFYTFIPNVFCAAWIVLLLIHYGCFGIDNNNILLAVCFGTFLVLFCFLGHFFKKFLLYQWSYHDRKEEMQRQKRACNESDRNDNINDNISAEASKETSCRKIQKWCC